MEGGWEGDWEDAGRRLGGVERRLAGGWQEARRRLGGGWQGAGRRLRAGWEEAGRRLAGSWEEIGRMLQVQISRF